MKIFVVVALMSADVSMIHIKNTNGLCVFFGNRHVLQTFPPWLFLGNLSFTDIENFA